MSQQAGPPANEIVTAGTIVLRIGDSIRLEGRARGWERIVDVTFGGEVVTISNRTRHNSHMGMGLQWPVSQIVEWRQFTEADGRQGKPVAKLVVHTWDRIKLRGVGGGWRRIDSLDAQGRLVSVGGRTAYRNAYGAKSLESDLAEVAEWRRHAVLG